MTKFILYFLLFTALIFWLLQNNGLISIDWFGYQISIELVFFIPILIAITIIFLKLFMTYYKAGKNRRLANNISAITSAVNALTYIKAGDIKSANYSIKSAQKILKGQPIISLMKSNVAFLKNDLNKTKKHLRNIVEAGGTLTITALNQLLDIAYKSGHLLEVESVIDRITTLFPKEGWALAKQGEFFCHTKKYEDALQAFLKTKKFNLHLKYDVRKRISTLYHALAHECYSKQDYDQALNYLNNSYDLLATTLLQAQIYNKIGKTKKALSLLLKKYKKESHSDILDLYLELGGNIEEISFEEEKQQKNNKSCWQCINCYTRHKKWYHTCDQCNTFDSINWI